MGYDGACARMRLAWTCILNSRKSVYKKIELGDVTNLSHDARTALERGAEIESRNKSFFLRSKSLVVVSSARAWQLEEGHPVNLP